MVWPCGENGELLRGSIQECAGSCSAGRQWKRWRDTVKDCLKKRCLNVRQAKRMVHDRNVWWGFVRGNVWGVV